VGTLLAQTKSLRGSGGIRVKAACLSGLRAVVMMVVVTMMVLGGKGRQGCAQQ